MKRTTIIIISVVATLILVGSIVVFIKCTTESPAANEDIMELPDLAPHAEDDGYEYLAKLEAEEEKDEEVTNEPAKEVAEADSADAPEETILEDPYEMYVITEDWMSELNDNRYVVERNGQLYGFDGIVMGDVPEKYGVGWEAIVRSYVGTRLYMYDGNTKGDVPTNLTSELATTYGDFPVFQVNKSEEVRIYSKETLQEIWLMPAYFYGYTLLASHIYGVDPNGSMYTPIYDHVCPHAGEITGSNPVVSTLNDEPVDDVYNLEYGQEYKYSWFEGTVYNETTLVANSKCYAINEEKIQIPVELTKNGYATADFSNLAPGFYYTQNKGIFEIVE